jgi:predicted ATPase
LVTLVGPGGIGKTRLALQAATEQVGLFAHGVAFAPLASVSPAEFIPTMAEAFAFSFHGTAHPQEQLLNYLRDKEMLLVLDSLEHLLDEAALLAEMLKQSPGLILLVTSRERLALREEWVYQMGGLTYPIVPPSSEEETGEELIAYSAIDLFQRRARQADRRFALAETTAPAVVCICRLVEGLPLAVELAAAWTATRSCEEIARELEHNLDILTATLRDVPERQRSVRATFEYSWHMLSEMERDVFARLSAFRGGFQQEAATQVAGASPATLAALVDKSLLRRDPAGRYSMHELLRQYAEEKLCAEPQAHEETQGRHARYFAAFLERQVERLKGAQQQAFVEIGQEIENARQAWGVAVACGRAREVEQSLESLYQFYDVQSRFQEGIELFAQAIERWSSDPQQERILGRMLVRQGALYQHRGRYPQARAALERSLAIFERMALLTEQVFCLVNLANVARSEGKSEEAERLAQQGLALSRQIGDDWGAARALFLLGTLRYNAGDVNRAEALLEESLALARASGNQRLVLSPLNTLGDVACHRGDYARAQRMFEECLAISRELGDQFNAAIHLNNLGTVLHQLQQYAEARSLYQESREICRKIGDPAGQAIALSNLGEIALILGDYTEARRCYQEGLAIGRAIQDQWTIMICLNNLGEIACVSEDCRGAAIYLAEALKVAVETQTTTLLMKVLVNLAVLFAREGQPDRAAELLTLARTHPASELDTQEKAKRLLNESRLAPCSEPRPLDVIVAEVLQEMSS